jgi:hypothetical protein
MRWKCARCSLVCARYDRLLQHQTECFNRIRVRPIPHPNVLSIAVDRRLRDTELARSANLLLMWRSHQMNTHQTLLGKERRALKGNKTAPIIKYRLTVDPNRPDCLTCNVPMTRYGNYKGAPIYKCVTCNAYKKIKVSDCVGPPIERVRDKAGEYDLVYCRTCSKHPRMAMAGYRGGRRMWVCSKHYGGCGSTVKCGCIHHVNGEPVTTNQRPNWTAPAPEVEAVYCVNASCHRRMVLNARAKTSTGIHPCYYCRNCQTTARKYQAPQRGVWKLNPPPKLLEPFTMAWSEMLGASCLPCKRDMRLFTRITARAQSRSLTFAGIIIARL